MKIGVATNKYAFNDELWAKYRKNGIEAIELDLLHADDVQKCDIKKVKEFADKHDVELWSVHLPFYPFEVIDLSSTDESLRIKTVEFLKKAVEKVAQANVDKVVVHPSAEPIEKERIERMAACKKSLSELAEFAKDKNVMIAVENLPRTCLGKNSDEISELINVHDNLKVCFDTNHLLGEDSEKFIECVGKDIITLHVSDYDFVDECHWLPGKGKIDWEKLIGDLKKSGYNGMWIYEVPFEMEDLQQFSDNAKKLPLY